VLALARSLGLRVTAEGVETPAQAQALQAMGCDGLQGYHFCCPVAAAEVPQVCARRWPGGGTPPDRAPEGDARSPALFRIR
jgi:EAL domain-containing protein (putative c-di-GMP-specific phosphodiesterase class I)